MHKYAETLKRIDDVIDQLVRLYSLVGNMGDTELHNQGIFLHDIKELTDDNSAFRNLLAPDIVERMNNLGKTEHECPSEGAADER